MAMTSQAEIDGLWRHITRLGRLMQVHLHERTSHSYIERPERKNLFEYRFWEIIMVPGEMKNYFENGTHQKRRQKI